MLVALLLFLLTQEETVFYDFPAGSTDADVMKTIKALSARIEDAKFVGLKALPLKRDNNWSVGIHSATPIGKNLLAALEDLTAIRGTVQILQRHEMNAQEMDLYKPGEKAPPGCVWRSWNGSQILFESASIDISAGLRCSEGDKTQQHPFIHAGVPYLEMSPASTAKVDKPEILSHAVLAIDGKFVNSALEFHHPVEAIKGMRITGNFLQNKTLGICVNHPLLLDLKRAQ